MTSMHSTVGLKHAIAELVRQGCTLESIAHDPPSVRFRTPTGVPCLLASRDGELVLIDPSGTRRFGTLGTALGAVTRPLAARMLGA